jgi:uncharacterized metal-binding protein YceD (DUF177 family)
MRPETLERRLIYNVGELLQPGENRLKTCEVNIPLTEDDPELAFLAPVTGTVKFLSTGQGVIGLFTINTVLQLPCSVDAAPYQEKIRLSFEREYQLNPQDPDAWPILPDRSVDVLPAIRDEILVNIPMKPLCRCHKG